MSTRSSRSKTSPSAATRSSKKTPSRRAASPVPEKNRVKDVYNIVDSTSLESRLVDLGYLPEGKVVVGQATLFIRVLDNNCNHAYVFVDGDLPGYVVASESDAATEEQLTGPLSLSMKQGLAGLLSQDLYGVAVEFDDSVVTLHREFDGTLDEHRYRFNSNDDTRAVDGFALLPIIRMSDLLGNPAEALASLARAVVVLDNERFSHLASSLDAMVPEVERLHCDFTQCYKTLGAMYPKITDALQQLYAYNARFLAAPPADDEARDKYQDVRYNISVRRDYLSLLFRCMSMVESCRGQIEAAGALVNEALTVSTSKIVDVDSVIPRPRI